LCHSSGISRATQRHIAMEFAPLKPGAQPPAEKPKNQTQVDGGRRYELRVVQQPKRARMCGFGDKDRRPITPPPCVRLIITDVRTGKEVDCNEIDHGMFVLNVDLWAPDGGRELNLVKHSPNTSGHPGSNISPISYAETSTPIVSSDPKVFKHLMINSNNQTSYAPITTPTSSYRDGPPPRDYGSQGSPYSQQGSQYGSAQNAYSPYQQHQSPPSVTPYSQPPQGHAQPPAAGQYSQGSYQPSYASTPTHPTYTQPQPHNGYQQPHSQAPSYMTSGAGIHAMSSTVGPAGIPYNSTRNYEPSRYPGLTTPAPTGMFTRNLIGSLSASAFRVCSRTSYHTLNKQVD